MKDARLFNEIDTFAAAWLRRLFPAAVVDERSIADVQPDDLVGYARCHFFGGIGGWEYALQLAGWPEGCEAWTGSCPCQPLSCAGKREGEADERHLWPEFYRLIAECRPATVFGEQVASKDGLEWLDGISLDLEELGYAVGSADLPAASQGAPHIRQRFFWVAIRQLGHTDSARWDAWPEGSGEREEAVQLLPANGSEAGGTAERRKRERCIPARPGSAVGLGVSNGAGPQPGRSAAEAARHRSSADPAGGADRLGHAADPRLSRWKDGRTDSSYASEQQGGSGEPERAVPLGGMGDTECDGLRISRRPNADMPEQSGDGTLPAWGDYRIIYCKDGRYRRISAQPGDEPLAARIPVALGSPKSRIRRMGQRARANRVGRLRGYGNAICPQAAATFVKAVMESLAT